MVHILQDRLGLLLRGEIVWQKSVGASGSCAWGSFRSPTNPVLRDVTERIIVASKGRFERARKVEQRRDEGLPSESTISAEDFMALTLDVWQLPSESARRVGHPAPFPVELPEKLIDLYTFADDLVLDPFMGSGSTLVAASRLGRRYVGYDLDAGYVELARAACARRGRSRRTPMRSTARPARTSSSASWPTPGSRSRPGRQAEGHRNGGAGGRDRRRRRHGSSSSWAVRSSPIAVA